MKSTPSTAKNFGLRLLHIDIETAPNLAHVWSIWQVNVALNQLISPGYVLCWAAKWDGDRQIFFDSVYKSGRKKMLAGIHALLNEADAVISYNGIAFDVPTLNAEFLQSGIAPPAPYKHIDLLQIAKKKFRLPSFKLEFVARHLGVGQKVKHDGHELWIGCMNNDRRSWAKMEEYNKNDVLLQEKVYRVFRPWNTSPPNAGLYAEDDRPVCPNCGSRRLQRRGLARTRIQQYARYQCTDCGAWSRSADKHEIGKIQRLPIV